MTEYASGRYNMLGHGGDWFPGLDARSVDDHDLTRAVAGSPFQDRIRDWLADAHALLERCPAPASQSSILSTAHRLSLMPNAASMSTPKGPTVAKLVMAIDQGTTSTRAILFDHDGLPIAIGPDGARADLPPGGLGRARPDGDLDATPAR